MIVDDNPSVIAAARGLLERDGITIAGVATNAADAVRTVEELRPDVALVDIDLGGESGFELARRLAPTTVILISTHAEGDYVDLVEASPAAGSWRSRTSRRARSARSSVRLEERDHREHATVVVRRLGQVELAEDAAHVLLHRALRDP